MRTYFRASTAILLLTLPLSGCITRPEVQHSEFGAADSACTSSQPDLAACRKWIDGHSAILYRLPTSMILITPPTAQELAGGGSWKATSIPALTGYEPLRALSAKQGAMKRTYLAATYLPNTRIPTSIGVQVADDRKAFVSAVGAIAKAGIFMAESPPSPVDRNKIHWPIIITAEQLARIDPSPRDLSCTLIDGSTRPCGKFSVGTSAGDAIPATAFFGSVGNTYTNAIALPACRSVDIELDMNMFGSKIRFQVTTNDPSNVRVVHLPAKGSVSLHPGCGFNISSDPPAGDSVWAVIAEVGSQYNAYQEERAKQEAAEKKDKPNDQ